MNQWQIIKQAIKDIEHQNNIEFGNSAWQIIKRMDKELSELNSKIERDIHTMYREQATCETCGENLLKAPCHHCEMMRMTEEEVHSWEG